MEITVDRLELLSAVQDVERIVPVITALEILRCAYLTTEDGKVTVVGCNQEVGLERRIAAQIREEGSIAIDATLLSSMMRTMGGDTVTISRTDTGCASIKGGTTAYKIPVMDAATYPRMEIPIPEQTVSVTNIPALAKRTVFAVSDEENALEMKCVHMTFSADGFHAVGSDGCRIADAVGDSKAFPDADILLPASSLEKLARLVGSKDTLQMGISGKSVVFTREDLTFFARLMEGRFLDTDQIMRCVKPCFTILTDSEQLRRALSSVRTVSGAQNRFSLTFAGAQLRLCCESEYGTSTMELEVVPLSGTPSGTYWYNAEKLLECLRAQSGSLMVELAQNGMLLLRTDALTCLQLAVREPRPIQKAIPKEKEKKTTAEKKAA